MLKRLAIKNFKSIDKEELELKPLTILTGLNSTGKSTVIQAILLLMRFSNSANRISLSKIVSAYTSPRDTRNRYTNQSEIDITLDIDSNGIEQMSLKTRDDGDGNVMFTGNMKVKLPKSQGEAPTEPPLSYLFESDEENSSISELFYLNATRLGPQTSSEIGDFKIGPLGEYIFSTYEKVKNRALPKNLVKFSESNTIGYQVSKWISEISDSELELKTERVTNKQVNVSFDSDGLKDVSPHNLGAGISYLAKIVILCFMAKEGDLVIIENPEIHLHPKSQSKLGAFLSFIAKQGIQLVIETHCEHLIQKVRFQVKNEEIDNEDVIIHYKERTQKPFSTLKLDVDGHFCGEGEVRVSFPKGFFDASVDSLLSLR